MKLPFELFMALRYLRPKRTFVSAITVLSVMGVVLGVMVLIVVISVMAGFEQELREKVMGFTAHITVSNNGILEEPDSLIELIRQNPKVTGCSPIVRGAVLMKHDDRVSTPVMLGIDPKADAGVMGLQKFLVDGDFIVEGEGCVVGQEFAERNYIHIGDHLSIFSPKNISEIEASQKDPKNGSTTLPTDLIVTGFFKTGLFDYDANFIVVSLEMAQQLYNLGSGVHAITVRVTDPMRAYETKADLLQRLPANIQAQTWMDLNEKLFSAIAVERQVMFFLLLFIIIVAAFGLTSTLITLTVQKSREIGLMKAVGASSGQILWVFLAHGLIVGVMGSLSGLAAGITVLEFRNQLVQVLRAALGIEIFPQEIYMFVEIPAVIEPKILAVICVSAVVICTLGALIPAWNAAKLQPAAALRS